MAGASEVKWYTLETTTQATGYRYIKISGAQYGNIAEVRIYGDYTDGTTRDAEINVKQLATQIVASQTQWGGSPDAATAAGYIFDGDFSTCGNLAEPRNNYYYQVDFGERASFTPVKFAVFPRTGSNGSDIGAEYVERMNGVKFLGSNDGQNWTDLTDAVSGLVKNNAGGLKWHELTVKSDVNVTGGYRYIRIVGGDGGNFAEAKFYGTYNKSN